MGRGRMPHARPRLALAHRPLHLPALGGVAGCLHLFRLRRSNRAATFALAQPHSPRPTRPLRAQSFRLSTPGCIVSYVNRPVLIVEDEPDIAEGLRYNLEREGLRAVVTETGEQGLAAALNRSNPPSLILLDLMLPGMSGTELCRRLRREPQTRRTPVIILTARGAESERVAGLELGADDYVTKPFSVRELIARVRAVLRRSEEAVASHYEDEKLRVHFEDMHVL